MAKRDWVDRCAWIAGHLIRIIPNNEAYPYPGLPKRADPEDMDESLSPG